MSIRDVETPEGKKLTVQECEVCLGTHQIIKSRNHPELPDCPRCKRTACLKCFTFVEITEENREIFKEHVYSQNISTLSCYAELCSECIDELELKYIEDMKVEDLPLYVSHHWESEAATDRYKERLQE